jgi:hypothetical protein
LSFFSGTPITEQRGNHELITRDASASLRPAAQVDIIVNISAGAIPTIAEVGPSLMFKVEITESGVQMRILGCQKIRVN